ncbi:hypothetical protein MY04_4796 [Flammeovirga sp. MY04]|uniref:DUF2586 family protein n=1 Tax=Flammeovirga sp. MY04 TaxID=1191459 RepID=UPI000806294A|nr:DUF2586 family protein [Flammeovirga sp. MY04]ANQ49613.1 hypothetical protein MY04_2239 [Flammeovirga sp. MY04]ANQ52131.1 hypothetical protein MY04_4796 [Flammeovirga sp. MY04]
MSKGLPNAKITILNDQLGRDITNTGEFLLVLTGIAVTDKIELNEVKKITSLSEAEALGLDAAYDTANSLKVHHEITAFYRAADEGIPLWIMLISDATTMADALDKNNNIVQKALTDAGGVISLVGINRIPDGAYSPTPTEGIDPDVITAVEKAHELSIATQSYKTPVRVLVGGRGYTGVVADLHDFSQDSYNGAAVVLASESETGYPAVGLTLGWAAQGSIQEAISKVERGSLPVFTGYLTDGSKIEVNRAETGQETTQDKIYDKRYIAFRKFANRDGYYFSGFLAATSKADDYSEIQRGRIIDYALRIAYDTLIDQIDNDIEIDTNGFPAAAEMKAIEGAVSGALTELLVKPGYASGVIVELDPNQNLLSTDTIVVDRIAVRPKGYPKYLEANLGFDNPLNS